jgi:hypothetical protein
LLAAPDDTVGRKCGPDGGLFDDEASPDFSLDGEPGIVENVPRSSAVVVEVSAALPLAMGRPLAWVAAARQQHERLPMSPRRLHDSLIPSVLVKLMKKASSRRSGAPLHP